MKQQAPVRLGPIALILTVISICLAILAILSFTTARADLRLAEKFAATVSDRYALEREGQTYLGEVSAALAAGSDLNVDEDGVLRHYLTRGDSMLSIGLELKGDGWQVVSWRQEQAWEPNLEIGDLWSGD